MATRDQSERERSMRLSQGLGMRPTIAAQSTSVDTRRRFVKATHGFVVGNAVRQNATTWVKSQADTPSNAAVDGIVAMAGDGWFILAASGLVVNLSGLTAGSLYFLDATTAGTYTATAPTHMRRLFKAVSTTEAVLMLGGPCLTVSTGDPGTTAAVDGDLWFKY